MVSMDICEHLSANILSIFSEQIYIYRNVISERKLSTHTLKDDSARKTLSHGDNICAVILIIILRLIGI